MQYTERSYKPHAAIISAVFHGLLLLLFLMFALHTPDPPLSAIGGSGIALNYGTSDEGSGDLQTMNTPNPSPENIESVPSNETPTQNTQVEETPVEPVKAVESESEVLTGDEDVPVEMKVKKEPVKKTPVVPVEKTEKKKTEPVTKTTPVVDKSTANGKTGTEQIAGGNNNGDKAGKIGDQGSKTGSVDAKALYGNEGMGGPGPGGVGGNLEMSGWLWDEKPVVVDNSGESGKVVIGIKVDDQGEIIKVWKIESSLSPSVYKLYEDGVRKGTLAKKSDYVMTAGTSEGKVIFIKKAK